MSRITCKVERIAGYPETACKRPDGHKGAHVHTKVSRGHNVLIGWGWDAWRKHLSH